MQDAGAGVPGESLHRRRIYAQARAAGLEQGFFAGPGLRPPGIPQLRRQGTEQPPFRGGKGDVVETAKPDAGTVLQIDADPHPPGRGRLCGQNGPAAAARQAQGQSGIGAGEPVAGPAVILVWSAVRAGVGSGQFFGPHAKDSGRKGPQGDPAGQEIAPGRRIVQARGPAEFGGVEEVSAVRSDVGKTNGPDDGTCCTRASGFQASANV